MQTESDRLMAIIDTLRFRNILVNGNFAEEGPVNELVEALEETFQDVVSPLATKADIEAVKAEILAALAESEARTARNQLVMVGVILAAIALAAGIIIGVLA